MGTPRVLSDATPSCSPSTSRTLVAPPIPHTPPPVLDRHAGHDATVVGDRRRGGVGAVTGGGNRLSRGVAQAKSRHGGLSPATICSSYITLSAFLGERIHATSLICSAGGRFLPRGTDNAGGSGFNHRGARTMPAPGVSLQSLPRPRRLPVRRHLRPRRCLQQCGQCAREPG